MIMTNFLRHIAVVVVLMALGETSLSPNCPVSCTGCSLGTLSCSAPGLREIPRVQPPSHQSPPSSSSGISEVSKINIRNQRFAVNYLQQANFTHYARPLFEIREVILHNCSLSAIHKYTFTPLSLLKILDLRENDLKFLHESAFHGLVLKILRLDDNPGVVLHRQAFFGLSLDSLSLRRCGLKQLDVSSLMPLTEGVNSMRNLYLTSNQLDTVSYSLQPLFQRLGLVDLLRNPLLCSCDNLWLADMSALELAAAADTTNNGNEASTTAGLHCLDRETGKAVLLKKVASTLLSRCGPPTIASVHIDVIHPGLIRLLCRGAGTAPLTLEWQSSQPIQVEEQQQQQSSSSLSENEIAATVERSTSTSSSSPAALQDSSTSNWHNVTCWVRNQFGNHSTMLRIHWPPSSENGSATEAWWMPSHHRRLQLPHSNNNATTHNNNANAAVLDNNMPSPGYAADSLAAPFSLHHIVIAVLLTLLITSVSFTLVYRLWWQSNGKYNMCGPLTAYANGSLPTTSSAGGGHHHHHPSSATQLRNQTAHMLLQAGGGGPISHSEVQQIYDVPNSVLQQQQHHHPHPHQATLTLRKTPLLYSPVPPMSPPPLGVVPPPTSPVFLDYKTHQKLVYSNNNTSSTSS